MEDQLLTVAQFNEMINLQVSGLGSFEVVGEITEKRISRNSGLMMTLKDEKDNAILKLSGFAPRVNGVNSVDVGMKVVATGTPQLYAPFGAFSLQVTSLVPHGEGSLQAAFEKLKELLEAKGYFAEDRKRKLPEFITKIALITADGSAAQTDFLKILGETKTGLDIEFYPVTVQGKNAPREIISAIRAVPENAGIDCIVLTRGGGSLEDLIAFNDEQVAEAVFASPIPVLSAVGHEKDTSISDLVADVVASTPSQAAYYLADANTSYIEGIAEYLLDFEAGISKKMKEFDYSSELALMKQNILSEIVKHDYREKLVLISGRITGEFSLLVQRTESLSQLMESYNPHNVLKRGYTLTRYKNKILKTVSQVKEGDIIETKLENGRLKSKIFDIDTVK